VERPDSLAGSWQTQGSSFLVGNMHLIREWRSKVYRASEQYDYLETAEWRKIRRAVLYRDHYHCIRCDQRFKSEQLSVHHIIPRDMGGPNTMSNLMALCNPCHDYVEINNLFSYAAIIGSYQPEGASEGPEEPEPKSQYEDNFERPDWHPWVYGGIRRRRRK
jgi:hypothetical protein